MARVDQSQIVDVRRGAELGSVLFAGTTPVFNRVLERHWTTPGNYSFTMPSWVTGLVFVVAGGGGGGACGNGGNGNAGRGGASSSMSVSRRTLAASSSKTLTLTIGAGGEGGTGASTLGKTGGTSSLIHSGFSTVTMAGGVGGGMDGSPTGRAGQRVGWYPLSALLAARLNLPEGTDYETGPAGTSNLQEGQRGAGGAGGNGGFFNSYSPGAKGGDGFIHLVMWGLTPP